MDDFESFLKNELGDTFKEAEDKAQVDALKDMATYLRAVYASNRKAGFGRIMSFSLTTTLFSYLLGSRNSA